MGCCTEWINFLAAEKRLVDNMAKVTEAQLLCFLHLCWVKYVKARIEPGNALPTFLVAFTPESLLQVLLLVPSVPSR